MNNSNNARAGGSEVEVDFIGPVKEVSPAELTAIHQRAVRVRQRLEGIQFTDEIILSDQTGSPVEMEFIGPLIELSPAEKIAAAQRNQRVRQRLHGSDTLFIN
jgi:hypothetical protein